jgi:hypothetical protein
VRNEHDRVDSALQSLGGQKWPGASHNPKLEDKLMRAFENRGSVSRIRRHPLLAACLVVLVLGSLGFVAAGGVEMVRSWFVTIEVNGEVIGSMEVVPDENGNAEFNIPPIDVEGDEAAVTTISIDSGECGDGEGGMKMVSVTLDEDGRHITVEQEESEGENDDE